MTVMGRRYSCACIIGVVILDGAASRVVPCEAQRERAVVVFVVMAVAIVMSSVKVLGHWRGVLARTVGMVAD
jgi:hypothetical protein